MHTGCGGSTTRDGDAAASGGTAAAATAPDDLIRLAWAAAALLAWLHEPLDEARCVICVGLTRPLMVPWC
jgi:hypothetical protein